MIRRLVLHLGLPRTGTTSIQRFLRDNPDLLARADALYPKLGAGIPRHASFQRTALTSHLAEEINHVALALELKGEMSPAAGDDTDTPLWTAALDQVASSGLETGIISYENFSLRPHQYKFNRLASRLGALDFSGVLYVRPQEDWARSLYGQKIRGKQRFRRPFREYLNSIEDRISFSSVIDNVRASIPLDRLIVSDFDRAAGAGLVEDFWRKAGMAMEDWLPASERDVRNASFPDWANLFLLWCNRARLPDAAFLELRRALSFVVRQRLPPFLPPGLNVATPQERAYLRKTRERDAEALFLRSGIRFAVRESVDDYRQFGLDDVMAIKMIIWPRLSSVTQGVLEVAERGKGMFA